MRAISGDRINSKGKMVSGSRNCPSKLLGHLVLTQGRWWEENKRPGKIQQVFTPLFSLLLGSWQAEAQASAAAWPWNRAAASRRHQ